MGQKKAACKALINTTAAVLGAVAALAMPAAAEVRDYDAQSLEWSMRRGEIAVLDFHVKRCPLCHSKSSILEQVISKDTHEGRLQAFLVDFENDQGLKKKYHVRFRDTALFIHKHKVVARMAGEFRHEALAQALNEAMNAAFARVDGKK